MINWSNFSNVLKLPPKILSGVAIATGLLLFLPNDTLEKMYMVSLKDKYGFAIGASFILSISILCCYVFWYIAKCLSNKYKQSQITKIRKNYIRNLDKFEKNILREMMNTVDKTLELPMNSGSVIKLNNFKVISPAGNNHLVNGFDMRIPYFIQPWACKELIRNPELLN